MKHFLTKHDIAAVNHPPNSPDLSPPDFYLFSKLKTALKRHRFQDVEEIQKNVTSELRNISSEDRNKIMKLVQTIQITNNRTSYRKE